MRTRIAGPALAAALVLSLLGSGAAARRKPAVPPNGGGAGLLWPVDLPPAVVSTFGEYRYDHLHAGIDISTGGGTGHAVRAAAPGAIYRLKVEWRGYGRALYLKHDDGRTSVYGHLERFEEGALGLESRVRRRRQEAGTPWPGDIFIDPPIAVNRGQVIAYSGESGVGLPHLHFEVRGPADDPVDPFRSGLKPPPEGDPPVLEALMITAATPATFIDGTWRERRVPLRRAGAAAGDAARLTVSGPFLATVTAWDPAGGGRAGLRAIEARVDGAECYRLETAGFRFEQYPIAGLIFDHRFSHLGPTTMGWRLGRLPGNSFATGGCAGAALPGAFDLAPGEHRFEIIATDAAGLTRRAIIDIVVPPPAAAAGAPAAAPDPPGAAGGGSAQAMPSRGATEMRTRFFPGFMEFVLPGGAGFAPPGLEACGEDLASSWRILDGGAFAGVAIGYERAAALLADPARSRAPGGCPLAGLLATTAIGIARPDAPLRLQVEGARVDIPAGGRFFAGPLVVARRPAGRVPEGLRMIGDAVDVLPGGEALDARATLLVDFDPVLETAVRLGLYRWDEVGQRWSFEDDTVDPPGRSLRLLFRRYGRFAMLADESPPRIGAVRPGARTAAGRRPEITARVTEVGKGLAWDGVTFLIDGRAIPSEFDPDRGMARPFEAPALAPGRHRLEVRAVDRAGNAAAPVELEFSVR